MVRAEEGQAWPQVNERVRLHEGSGGSSTKATIHHCSERPDVNYAGGVKRTWHVIRDDGIYHMDWDDKRLRTALADYPPDLCSCDYPTPDEERDLFHPFSVLNRAKRFNEASRSMLDDAESWLLKQETNAAKMQEAQAICTDHSVLRERALSLFEQKLRKLQPGEVRADHTLSTDAAHPPPRVPRATP